MSCGGGHFVGNIPEPSSLSLTTTDGGRDCEFGIFSRDRDSCLRKRDSERGLASLALLVRIPKILLKGHREVAKWVVSSSMTSCSSLLFSGGFPNTSFAVP